MDTSEEIRELRETITSLQWGLIRTLGHLESLGRSVRSDTALIDEVVNTRQAIMQLRSPRPTDQD